jgi:tripeptide aminopeptidase
MPMLLLVPHVVLVAGLLYTGPGIGETLLADPAVRKVLEVVKGLEPEILENQVRICEIPAPTFAEERRAALVRTQFENAGLRHVRIDAAGNVLGELPGRSKGPAVVIASHLDTVFPEGTDVTVRREGTVFRGPGIGDNCRGLAVLVGLAQALQRAPVSLESTVVLVANVGEEGLGNFKGVRHLVDVELRGRMKSFVSIDGSGIGFVHVGVGARRYRITFTGPGGHSYFRFGQANPMHALGRLIAAIGEFRVAAEPRATFSVGRAGGGTSVNSIAREAWLEVDLRSHDAEALAALDARLMREVAEAVRRENERWGGRGAIEAAWEDIGHREPGVTPADSEIVRATVSVTEVLGLPVRPFPATTDSNVPMAIGIPAVTLDGGGDGAGGHSLDEHFDSTDSWKGTQRALLLMLGLAWR